MNLEKDNTQVLSFFVFGSTSNGPHPNLPPKGEGTSPVAKYKSPSPRGRDLGKGHLARFINKSPHIVGIFKKINGHDYQPHITFEP